MKAFYLHFDSDVNVDNLIKYLHSTYKGKSFNHCDVRVTTDVDFVMMWVNELEEDEFTNTLVIYNDTILRDTTFLDLLEECAGVIEDEDGMPA